MLTEYYHLTVNGTPMCATPFTSTELEKPVSCEYHASDHAANARKKLADQLPNAIVAVVPGRCPRPNVAWEENR
jgi:hypothetical protein